MTNKRILLLFPLVLLIASGCSLSLSKKSDGGIFFSNSGGASWEQRIFAGTQKNKNITIGKTSVKFFVFHPQETESMWVSTDAGLYFSDSNGKQWKKYAAPDGVYTSFLIDPSAPTIQYGAVGTSFYKTTDSGESWTQNYVVRQGGKNPLVINAMAIDPVATERLWVADSSGSIFLSEDFGNSWTLISSLDEAPRQLIVSNVNPALIYAIMRQKGFAKSTDGGKTWSLTESTALSTSFPGSVPIASFQLRPGTAGDITIASAYGVLRSTNGGFSWQVIPTLIPNKTTPISQALINPLNANSLYFTAGNIFYITSDGGETWKTYKTIPTANPISTLTFNPHTPDQLWLGVSIPKK